MVLHNELIFLNNPFTLQNPHHFLLDITPITPYITPMSTQKLSKPALACKLLIFNVLVAFIFVFWIPFSLVFYISLGIWQSFFDFISPWVEENKEIVRMNKTPTKIKNKNAQIKLSVQHNSIGLN